jgi:DNA invertase Pin-like site-specific DNA recombinase
MRCAIYRRLSEDRNGEGENVEIQRVECSDYAEQRGWGIVGDFCDDDISASRYSTRPRPRYNDLLAAVRAGQVDVVLVTEMPRLYRRLEELLELIHLAESTPLRRIQPTEGDGYDLSTGEGIHNAVAAVNNAALEVRKTSDRTKRKKAATAKEGRFHGGRRPYGYDYVEARGKRGDPDYVPRGLLAVNEAEAAVVKKIAGMILDGTPLAGIVRDLNGRGVPTAKGGLWRKSTVKRLFGSKLLLGIRTHNGREYKAKWDAILDEDTFERVNLVLRAAARGSNGSSVHGRSYLLTGRIFCGRCGEPGASGRPSKPGAPLVGFANAGGGLAKRRYFCKRYDEHGRERGCAGTSRLADPIELLVAEAVLDLFDSPRMAEVLGAAAEDGEMAELVDRYQASKVKLDDLISDYASGLLNREQLAQAKEIVEAAMEATSRRMEQLQSGRAVASIPVGQSFRQAWEGAGLEWRRDLIDLVVDKVILHPSGTKPPLWPPTGSELAKRAGRQWHFDPAKVEIRWKV